MLVPPADPAALANGIVTVLRDKPLRRRLGEEGRRRTADFDIRSAIGRMEEVYAALLT
jgi:glycosyltransferase involved in cell wall biosynthesis